MTHLVIIVDKVGETSKHTIALNNEHGLYSQHFSLRDVRCKSELVDRPTQQTNTIDIQSGASSPAKHGGAYFSAVYGSIVDPAAAPGHCKPQVC